MAEELYGSQEEAIGKIIKLSGLPFTIVGTFRERVDTFGQTEVVDYTMLIPYTVSRYFTDTPTVKQIYFSTADPSMVSRQRSRSAGSSRAGTGPSRCTTS